MSGAGYKLLGWLVWRGGRRYARRRYGRFAPSRRAALGGLIGLLGAVAAAAAARWRGRRPTS